VPAEPRTGRGRRRPGGLAEPAPRPSGPSSASSAIARASTTTRCWRPRPCCAWNAHPASACCSAPVATRPSDTARPPRPTIGG
jgi:hypothetical protein